MRTKTDQFPFIEPWRCENCHQLIYNTTHDGYPAPGAPIGSEITPDGVKMRVCYLCTQLYLFILESPYFIKQHTEWLASEGNKKRLSVGGNYLDKKD